MALVLLVAAAGLAYTVTVPEHWLRGAIGLAGAMLFGGLARLVLPPYRAGLLVVRGRTADVVFYFGIGIVLILLALRLSAPGTA